MFCLCHIACEGGRRFSEYTHFSGALILKPHFALRPLPQWSLPSIEDRFQTDITSHNIAPMARVRVLGVPLQQSVTFTSDTEVVTVLPDRTLALLDTRGRQPPICLFSFTDAACVSVSTSSNSMGAPTVLACGTFRGEVLVTSLVAGAAVVTHRLQGHSERVSSVAFSPDGTWLASASADRTVRLWHLAASAPASAPQARQMPPCSTVDNMTFSSDNAFIVRDDNCLGCLQSLVNTRWTTTAIVGASPLFHFYGVFTSKSIHTGHD